MIDERFVILGAVISLVGVYSYFIDTIKGRIQPNRMTWLLWSVIPFVAFIAQIRQGVSWPSLLTFMAGFNPLLIFLATFAGKKAEWRLSRLDTACGALSVTGILLWYATQVGNIAIIFSMFADALALVPTFVKAYRRPGTENHRYFIWAMTSNAITLLTIKEWTFANAGFAAYLLLANTTLFMVIRYRPATIADTTPL